MSIKGKRVLFCVLNWGLGHATRSIPIINYLHENNCEVTIASDGEALIFLKKEFPQNKFYELPAYGVQYTISPIWGTFFSTFTILRAIKREHAIVIKLAEVLKIELIISDNRYGAFCPTCKSYLISHQLNPFFFVKPRFLSLICEWVFAKALNRFGKILVPDDKVLNLTGRMSVNRYVYRPIFCIGILNRFTSVNINSNQKSIDILIVISGPEPSRTSFESYIFSELNDYSGNVVVILGREKTDGDIFDSHFDIRGIVGTQELYLLYHMSKIIVSRSGYSSLMDYISLRLNAVLIPTPNMPEQEYLAHQVTQIENFKTIIIQKGALLQAIEECKFPSELSLKIDINMFNAVF